jgi:hypothetical protein
VLSRLLQDPIGGNSKTTVVHQLWTTEAESAAACLAQGQRYREVVNQPRVNEDCSQERRMLALVHKLHAEN